MEYSAGIRSWKGYEIPAMIGRSDAAETGTVVMAHGIFGDKDEHGRYVRQTAIHHAAGRRTLRFDWQGHGEHPVPFLESTVAGNLDDLQTVLDHVMVSHPGQPIDVIASSFGASIFLLAQLCSTLPDTRRAVLLNPITDYDDTFRVNVGGELADVFSAQAWSRTRIDGWAELVPGKPMSRRLAAEFRTMQPYRGFDILRMPTLVLHGTADKSVSFSLTEENAKRGANVTFVAIEGADHAFAEPAEEAETFHWISTWFG